MNMLKACRAALKDSTIYPTGLKVSDEELDALNIVTEPFHGDWNYTIKPQERQSSYSRKPPKAFRSEKQEEL